MHRRFRLAVIAIGLSLALLASACSSSDSKTRSAAGGSAGDPTTLPALPAGTGAGERTPMYLGAVVTPSTWVSSSVSPTLAVPGAAGAWTFTLDDLSGGTSGFGPRVYRENGNSSRIPIGAGLLPNRVYTWFAESPGQDRVGGSFMVDVQMAQSQEFDSVGGVSVGLASGEASTVWNSHSMTTQAGQVGFSLKFEASNPDRKGAPKGWVLQGASSSDFSQIQTMVDGTVSLVSLTGLVSTYREGPAGTWNPVRLSDESVDTTGSAPVLMKDGKGNWVVTSKQTTSVFADDGNDGVANLVSVSGADAPVLSQTWSNGFLSAISDPVSGRSISMTYGGGDCPKPPSGFVAAPEGMICRTSFWDGTSTSVFYVAAPDVAGGASIGRIVDYPEAKGAGASVTDFAYDEAGRLSRVRSPLVAAAAASGIIGIDDQNYWTSVTYREDGKVATITENAAGPGATRCTRSYSYEGSSSAVEDSCFGGRVASVLFDPTTFLTSQLINSAGQVSTYTWDLRTAELLYKVEADGLATATTYKGGQIVSTRGPSKTLGPDVQSTRFTYDQVVDPNNDGVAMRGLDVVYWPSATEPGTNGVQELGPRLDGALVPSLLVNWPSSPAGKSDDWSALMTGGIRIEKAGTYSFRSTNDAARLRLSGVVCNAGACDALRLEPGVTPLQIEVTSASPQASMNIEWSGPDTGGVVQSIPTDRLVPLYGFTTTTDVNDPNAPEAISQTLSKVRYDNPANGRISARLTGLGTQSQLVYEAGSGGRGGWGRQSESIQPLGNRYRYTYWGDKESASAPCPGMKSAIQGGTPKESIAPGPDGGDGPSVTHWVDSAGRNVATKLSSGATSCLTIDGAGRVVVNEILGMGQTTKMTFDYAVNGNPLVTKSVEVIGNETVTSEMEIDLLGREVRSVDPNGITSKTTYDTRTGKVATVTTQIPNGPATVYSQTFDQRGWLASVALNSRILATITYNEDGTAKAISYGNGVVSLNSFDDVNRLVETASRTSDGTLYRSTRAMTAAGRVLSQTYQAGALKSDFNYTYDDPGRLVAASVTKGLSEKAIQWQYSYDANSNRTGQSVAFDSATPTTYSYGYDGADRLISTNDPSASSGITYDARGNALTVGSTSFTYDAANNVSSMSDGTVSATYERGVTGNIRSRTMTGGPDAGTIKFGAEGVTLDAEGRAMAQVVALPGGVKFINPFADATKSEWIFTSITGNDFFRTDDAGSPKGTPQLFDPFGQALSAPDPSQPGVPVTGWQGVTGNETVALSVPVVMMGLRAYIPALGRFVQLDPQVGGSANGYDFANQDPVNVSDPSGAASDGDSLIGAIATVLGAVVSAVVAPTAGFWIGFAIGAVVGAVAYAATWGVFQVATQGSQFDFVQLAISAGVSALSGGLLGRWRFSQGCKAARYLGVEEKSLTISFVRQNAKELRYVANGIKNDGRVMVHDQNNFFAMKAVYGQYKPDLIPRTQQLMQINEVRKGAVGPSFLSRTAHLVRRSNDVAKVAAQRARDDELWANMTNDSFF